MPNHSQMRAAVRTPLPFAAAVSVLLCAIVLYDGMGAIVKHLSDRYPVQQLAVFRNLFGLLPSLVILLSSRSWKAAGRPVLIGQWKLAAFRGGLGVFAQMSFYLALFHIELATASALVFAGPLFVTLLSIPILRHKIGPWRWTAVVVGFAGVMMVLRPSMDGFSWHLALPLCAAFGFASTSVISALFERSTPTALINLYYTVFALLGSLALTLLTSSFTPIDNARDWIWLLAMGLIGGLAAYCMTTAHRLVEPSSLSPFQYLGIPSSFLLGWALFEEAPFDRLFPGILLIVGGGSLVIWQERNLSRGT